MKRYLPSDVFNKRMNIECKKLLMIMPSSVIFFLLIPLGSLFFGKTMDGFLGFEAMSLGLTGILTATVLLLVGGYYVLESIRILFKKGRGIPLGDFFPEDQSTELITTGIYGQTRNPMLFGYLLCLIALGLLVNSVTSTFIVPTLFITIWTIWIKTREEPALETRFGEPYRRYKTKTSYLIPRPWRKTG